MNLETFIESSLSQIIIGVTKAQAVAKKHGGCVMPIGINRGARAAEFYETDADQIMNIVQFDVAVSASEGSETKGGIGVVVAAIALGTQGKTNEINSSVSRIKIRRPNRSSRTGRRR